MNTSYNKSAAGCNGQWSNNEIECKTRAISTKNEIKVGGYTIKWAIPSNHLAYKRLQYLSLHPKCKCSLSDVFTADWEQYFDFNLTKSDACFISLAERVLTAKHYLIYVPCLGCGKDGAPTTDNNPAGWHMKCWRICLDNHQKAAEGYPGHLANSVAPEINKYFPKLNDVEFTELYCALEDQFWVRLFDLKTRGRYTNQRRNDRALTYTGLCGDFSLHKMTQNDKYADYVIKMLREKYLWHSRGIKYSCITAQSFINYSMTQDDCKSKDKEKTQSALNSNNQAFKPKCHKNDK